MNQALTAFVMLFCLLSLGPTTAQNTSDSHIEANEPSVKDFSTFLNRDLKVFFSAKLEVPVQIEHQMLRNGATQSGVALPKYYLWVRVFDQSGGLLEEGAVRVAAIEKQQFEVTHFLSTSAIKSEPDSIGLIFPAALVPKIQGLAKIKVSPP